MMNSVEINKLFDEIANTTNEQKLRSLENQIWLLWLEHPSPYIQQLMQSGIDFLKDEHFNEGIEAFTEIIKLDPTYPEAWNKRAVAYYMRGIYKKAIADIERTLQLEPRHFGALGGLYSIYITIGDLRGAQKALLALEKVYPQRPDLKKHIGQLRLQIAARKY